MWNALVNWWRWVWTEPTELGPDDEPPVTYSVYQSEKSGFDFIACVSVHPDERTIYAYGNDFKDLEEWARQVWLKLLADPKTDEVFVL